MTTLLERGIEKGERRKHLCIMTEGPMGCGSWEKIVFVSLENEGGRKEDKKNILCSENK